LYGVFAGSPLIIKITFNILFIWTSIPGTLVFLSEFFLQIYAQSTGFGLLIFVVSQFYLNVVGNNAWFLLTGGDPLQYQFEHSFTLTRHEFFFLIFLMLNLLPGTFTYDLSDL
jgi:hypothetical protein